MSKRVNSVILQCGERREEFEVNHAERILRMPDNGGWQLPEDSNFIMDEQNGLTIKRDQKQTEKSGQNPDNK